jgi:hypothetical protein
MCVHRSIEEILGHFRTICFVISTVIFPGRVQQCARTQSPNFFTKYENFRNGATIEKVNGEA